MRILYILALLLSVAALAHCTCTASYTESRAIPSFGPRFAGWEGSSCLASGLMLGGCQFEESLISEITLHLAPRQLLPVVRSVRGEITPTPPPTPTLPFVLTLVSNTSVPVQTFTSEPVELENEDQSEVTFVFDPPAQIIPVADGFLPYTGTGAGVVIGVIQPQETMTAPGGTVRIFAESATQFQFEKKRSSDEILQELLSGPRDHSTFYASECTHVNSFLEDLETMSLSAAFSGFNGNQGVGHNLTFTMEMVSLATPTPTPTPPTPTPTPTPVITIPTPTPTPVATPHPGNPEVIPEDDRRGRRGGGGGGGFFRNIASRRKRFVVSFSEVTELTEDQVNVTNGVVDSIESNGGGERAVGTSFTVTVTALCDGLVELCVGTACAESYSASCLTQLVSNCVLQ